MLDESANKRILNHVVNNNALQLDTVFGALANRQRRDILSMLLGRSQTISELARPLKMSLPAIHKHIRVLERANLIESTKIGRSNEIVLQAKAMVSAQEWIERHQAYWTGQLDALDAYIATTKKEK